MQGDKLASGAKTATFYPAVRKMHSDSPVDHVVPAPMHPVTPRRAPRKLIPLGDRIVVKRQTAEQISTGGIVLAEISQKRPAEGVVVAIGPGLRKDGEYQSLDFQVGELVLFGKYAGHEQLIGDEEFTVLREEEIIGKLL